MPLPDGRLVPRAPAPAAAAPRVVPRRLAGAPAPPLLLPLAVRPDVGAGAPHRHAGRLQARHGARRLPPAPPRLRLAPADAPAVSRAARRRRRVARLPVPGGQPHLGRHDREHAHRGVLVHLRRRLRRPLPGRPLPGPRRRPGALGSRRRPRPHLLCPRLRRALGGPHRLGAPAVGSPTRGRAGPRDLEDAGLARGRGRARLCPRRARPRAPPGGLGLDDALRRRVDRDHDAGALPGAPLAALPRRGRRARGASRAPPGEAPGRTPAPARLRRARRRRAGRGRPRPRGRGRALRAPRAALARSRRRGGPRARPRPPGPRRRGGPRPRPGRRGLRRLALGRAAPLGRLELLGSRGEGAVARVAGAQRPAPGRALRPAGGLRVQPGARAGGLPPHARDGAVLLRPLGHRGRLQPVEHDHAPRLLPPVRAPPLLVEPVPQPGLLALRPPERPREAPPVWRGPGRGDEPHPRRGARRPARGRAGGAHSSLHALPPRGPRSRHRGAAGLRPGARVASSLARPGVPLGLSQAPEPRRARVHGGPAVRRRGRRRLGPAARAPAARRGRGDGAGRGGGDPHHDEPAGPPAPRQGLLPPALEGRGRRRSLPRLARPHADRPLAARGEAHLRGAHVVRSRRPRARPGGCRPAPGRDRGPSPRGSGGPRGRVSRARSRGPADRAPRGARRAAPRSAALALRRGGRPLRAGLAGLRRRALGGGRRVRPPRRLGRARRGLPQGRDAVRPGRGAPPGRACPGSGRGVHSRGGGRGGHLPQALHSGARAREAAGDPEGAAAWRGRLRDEFPETPWARPLP